MIATAESSVPPPTACGPDHLAATASSASRTTAAPKPIRSTIAGHSLAGGQCSESTGRQPRSSVVTNPLPIEFVQLAAGHQSWQALAGQQAGMLGDRDASNVAANCDG